MYSLLFSGDAFHHAVNEQLGIVERDDTIKVIEDMVDNLGYIDKSRVAVWGWSYGGFLTAQILAKQQKYVKCGIAIAPVSQWELYGKFIILTCIYGHLRCSIGLPFGCQMEQELFEDSV